MHKIFWLINLKGHRHSWEVGIKIGVREIRVCCGLDSHV